MGESGDNPMDQMKGPPLVIVLPFILILFSLGACSDSPTGTPEENLPLEEEQVDFNSEDDTDFIREIDRMQIYYVSPASFQMGAADHDEDADDEEKPQHPVRLIGFWIVKTEVSNQQYKLCVEDGSCELSKYDGDETYNGPNYPVVGVDWQDAVNYCTWAGGRLPTEAEWEYAAKGERGSIYPWGNEYNGTFLNACDLNCSESWADKNLDDGYQRSAPVGSFPGGASWVGALDMAGNVWEWVWDWCGVYGSDPQENPIGPEEGECKIIRGGAWASPPAGLRTTYRIIGTSEIGPTIRHPNIGFRCVISDRQ
ncbi:MAG: formylglycine-generating enzyme family protein [Anaerolineales bacterium]|nr:MAG: formylglycine-generating enzyme family protein [Anaerolineales bacterium]